MVPIAQANFALAGNKKSLFHMAFRDNPPNKPVIQDYRTIKIYWGISNRFDLAKAPEKKSLKTLARIGGIILVRVICTNVRGWLYWSTAEGFRKVLIDLKTLPGIGEYTAAAIASIALVKTGGCGWW